MAEFKKAIEKTLKPFARKVGSDIKGIESKVFAGKPINVVEFGIDNTGATDVTAKLNELFKKVHDEDYTEVIFPDGTYKISGLVNVMVPSDRKKYVYIHAQNRYKAKIEMHGTREQTTKGYSIYVGFQLQPENFEATTTRGYNVRFDGFVIEGHELPVDETNLQPSTSIYAITSSQESHDNFNISDYKLYNFTCTNMEFINTYCTISLNYNIFDADLKNIYIDGAEYPLDLSANISNNNSLDNITIKNCKNGTNISAKCSVKNIDIIYDNESIFANNNMPNYSFTPYLMSNVSIKGFCNSTDTTILTINAQSCTISDIRLDLKPIGTDNIYQYDSYIPSFINFTQSSSESGLVNVSDVTFEKFEENFASVFEKVPKFAFFNTSIPLSLHNVSESDHLKFFQEKAINVTYKKAGSYNLNYNTKNESFKPRPYLGTDRNMNGTDQALASTFGAIYLASSEGTPLTGKNNEDYSENTAGVKGDIFTELDPEKYGHFAYVSTYENTTDLTLDKTKIDSLTYNEADKLYTITFNEMPVWTTGTLKGKAPNVGSIINDNYNNIIFEITEVDESAKTFKLKATPETEEGFSHPYTFSQSYQNGIVLWHSNKIIPRKINRMKNMTYVTVPIIHSGATENRPTEHLVVGQMYFDTTVGAPVFWNGSEWVKANTGEIDTSSLATKEEIKAIPAANITQDDNHYFVTKYQQAKLGNLYNRGEFDNLFSKKKDLEAYTTTAALTTKLGDYTTTADLTTKLGDYTTTAALTTKLGDYATTASVDSKVANVVKEDALTTKLADYPTKTEMQAAIAAIPAPTVDTSTLVTKEELNATLNAINEKLKQIRGE